MLNWDSPQQKNYKDYREIIGDKELLGSDISLANLFLLKEKYKTEVALSDGFLFRKYYGKGARCGYAFPIGDGDKRSAFQKLIDEANNNSEIIRLSFITENERSWIEENYPDKFSFFSDRGDCDYIYSRNNLANLKGKRFSKKRNHISIFNRTFENYCIEKINGQNKNDALQIADKWYREHDNDASFDYERKAIIGSLENFQSLELFGAILYANGKPAGMTVASFISDGVVDIHFEKVLKKFADFGGYAVINKMFAQSLDENIKWINREEDINIDGLRKAKLSYHPDIIFEKFGAVGVK